MASNRSVYSLKGRATQIHAAGDHHRPRGEQVEAACDVPAQRIFTATFTRDAAVDHRVDPPAQPKQSPAGVDGDEVDVGGAQVERVVGRGLEVRSAYLWLAARAGLDLPSLNALLFERAGHWDQRPGDPAWAMASEEKTA